MPRQCKRLRKKVVAAGRERRICGWRWSFCEFPMQQEVKLNSTSREAGRKLAGDSSLQFNVAVFDADRVFDFPAAFFLQVLGFLLHESLKVFQAGHPGLLASLGARQDQMLVQRLYFFRLTFWIR